MIENELYHLNVHSLKLLRGFRNSLWIHYLKSYILIMHKHERGIKTAHIATIEKSYVLCKKLCTRILECDTEYFGILST